MPAAWLAEGTDAGTRSASATSLRHYQLKKQVYKGTISRVFEAFDRRDGAHVCLKVYKKTAMNVLQRAQLDREIEIHGRLTHPNIAQLHEVFEDDRAVYMVQEFVTGGDLYTDLMTNGKFDEYRAAGVVIAPMLQALRYIHGRGIIHRDIKAENIMVDPDGTVKLADFGFAIDTNDDRPGSRLGTWEYMAPEIHLCPFKNESKGRQPDTTYSTAVDIWAMGVLAYEVLTGKPPFPNQHGEITHRQLMESDIRFPSWMSMDSVSFVKAALCKDPEMRPTARQLLKHRWLRAFQKEIALKSVASGPSSGNVLSRVAATLPKSLEPQSIVKNMAGNGATSPGATAGAGAGGAAAAGGKAIEVAASAGVATETTRVGRPVPSKVHSLHNLQFHQQQQQQQLQQPQQQQQQQRQGGAGAGTDGAGAAAAVPPAGPAVTAVKAAAATAKGAAAAISSFFAAQGQQWDARLRRSSAVEVELSAHSALPTYSSGLPMATAGRRMSGVLTKASLLADAPGAAGAAAPPRGGGDAVARGAAAGGYDGMVMLMRATSGSEAPDVGMSDVVPDQRQLSLPVLKITRSGMLPPQLPLLATPLPEDGVAPPPPPSGTSPVPGTPMRTRRGSMVVVQAPPGNPGGTPTSPFSPVSDQGAFGMNGVGSGGGGMSVEGRRASATLLASTLAPAPPGGTNGVSPSAAGGTGNRFRRASRLLAPIYDTTTQQPVPQATIDGGQA